MSRQPDDEPDLRDARILARVLLYGDAGSRRAAAQLLLRASDRASWALLAGTVRSNEPWLLRARCLEVLGLAAGADRRTAETILTLLFPIEDQPANPTKE